MRGSSVERAEARPSAGLQGPTPLEAIAKLAERGCKTALTEPANDRSMGAIAALFLSIQMLAEGQL